MNLEIPLEQKKEDIPIKKMEISLESADDLNALESQLRNILGAEGAEQYVFILRSMIGMDFVNQCREATKELADKLNTNFGGEESFFELVPSASFSDVRSYDSLDKIGYRGNYHSVGVVKFNSLSKEPYLLMLDLTYGVISGKGNGKNILVLTSPGDMNQALVVLKEYYGGNWREELRLDKKSGKLVSIEK